MDAIAVRRVVVGAIVVLLVALAALLVFVFVILPRLGLSPETWGKNAQEAPSTPTEKADYLDNLSAQSSTSLPARRRPRRRFPARRKPLTRLTLPRPPTLRRALN